VQLHEAQGPFSVTVFVSPEAVRGGLADVSVLVQWRKNGEVVLDADVSLALDPPNGLAMASESSSSSFSSSSSKSGVSALGTPKPPKRRDLVPPQAQSGPLCGLSPTAAPSTIDYRLSSTINSQLSTIDFIGRQHQDTVPATRAQASNKLLYAAALKLNAPGDWRLHVYVLRGSDSARFDCLLPVTRTSAKPSGLWPYLILPPIVIAAFAMNQRLREKD